MLNLFSVEKSSICHLQAMMSEDKNGEANKDKRPLILENEDKLQL